MSENETKKPKRSSKKSSHVRFTDEELARLERDETNRGLSIPVLLKEAYFEGRPTTILMSKEETKAFMTELIRQGNNLNQVARQVNAGIAVNVREEIAKLSRALEGMTALLRGKVMQIRNA